MVSVKFYAFMSVFLWTLAACGDDEPAAVVRDDADGVLIDDLGLRLDEDTVTTTDSAANDVLVASETGAADAGVDAIGTGNGPDIVLDASNPPDVAPVTDVSESSDTSVPVDVFDTVGTATALDADVATEEDGTIGPDITMSDAGSDIAFPVLPETCRGDDPFVWRDLTTSGFHGYLSDFGTDPAWAGSGIPSDPYRLEMAGTPDPRIELGGATDLRLAQGSVEFWVRAASTTFANKMLYNHRNDAELAGIVVISQDNQWKALGCIEANGGRWSTVFAAPGHRVGVWQHVVLTWGAANGQTQFVLHVDGVATGTGAMNGAPYYTSKGTAQIGGLNGGHGSFAGGIAVARIWPRVLSAAEVKGLYAADAVTRFGRDAPAEVGVVPVDAPLVHLDATPCAGL